MRRIVIAALLLLITVVLFLGWRPMTPARTADDYRHKAKDTAESVLSALHAVPAFRSDLEAAREEVSRLRSTKPNAQACAADAAALAERPY